MVNLEAELEPHLYTISMYRGLPEHKLRDKITITPFELSPEPLDLIAIDGSYSFVLGLSSMWLAIVRVGALTYAIALDGGYILKSSELIERPILVTTNEKVANELGGLQKLLYNFGAHAQEPQKEMVNSYRRLLELELTCKLAERTKDSIIATDGTLTSFELTDLTEKSIKFCETNNNILVGVSKDSDTHAFGSYRTDEEFLQFEKRMSYIRVPTDFEEKHKGLLYGDVYFAKLYPHAPKWFRVDIGTYKHEPQFVFSNLAHYAKSELCLGYIYPLLEVHRYVVTVRQFHTVYERMILELAPKFGIPLDYVISGLTNLDGRRRGAFHEYIDKVCREVK